MVTLVCEKSGLVFEAENRRRRTHPEIAFYTQHPDYEYRYFCLKIIEKGKQEGWDTIERFKEEISLAWNKEKNSDSDAIAEKDLYQCNYIARITGSSEKYRFQRDFIPEVSKTERKEASSYRYYDLEALEDGYYEVNHRSRKGNDSRYYWLVSNSERTEIELSEVESQFPVIVKEELLEIEALNTPIYDGCFELGGKVYEILSSKTVQCDEDGIPSTHPDYSAASLGYETTYWKYAEATPHRTEKFYQAKQEAEEKAIAIAKEKQLRERIKSFLKTASPLEVESGTKPPEGLTEIVIHQNYAGIDDRVLLDPQNNLLWVLYYNGRDGDDWSMSNYGIYILRRYELPDFLRLS